ncbi:MAG: tetraacyldisaccharide 4'-kinase [Flavobacteriia bacterium]|nr:tetraacyldisaccharide 4'-kinase [Flavobacteriia bacterium]
MPFSIVYGFVVFTRNLFFDYGIFSMYIIPKKSICIGNLSTGGTGKTPMVLFLTKKLKDKYSVGILSRGYGRKTNGYLDVFIDSDAGLVGDEPLLFAKNLGDGVKIAVCEDRKKGIHLLLSKFSIDLILLDDAFQHRKVKAGLNILINDYNQPIHKDFLLPMGNLREGKNGIKRADLMIISKCPMEINENEKSQFISNYSMKKENIFFSHIVYEDFIPFFKNNITSTNKIILVTGIANSKPIIEYLEKNYEVFTLNYSDHYQFNEKDIEQIHKKFDTFASREIRIVCTEKDFVRFGSLLNRCKMEEYPWYYLPIRIQIDREQELINKIENYVRSI